MTKQRVCFHCYEKVPAGFDLQVCIDGQSKDMCCHGCAAVASMLSGSQWEQFYQLRSAAAARPNVRDSSWWQAFDDPQLINQLATSEDQQHYTLAVNVSHLRCAACAWLLESCIRQLPGVKHLVVNFATGQGELYWDSQQTQLSTLLIEADKLGYPMQPAMMTSQGEQRANRRTSLRRMIVAALGMFQVMMMSVGLYLGVITDMQADERDFVRWIALLLTTPVVWYSGWPFFQAAWRQIRYLRPAMDIPVSLAVLLAWGASCINTFVGSGEVFFDSAVMFIFFLTVSRHLEQGARLKAQAVSDRASQLLPLVVKRQTAHGKTEVVQAMQLKVGNVVLSTAGETLAADGILLGQHSVAMNESLLTGESQAIRKEPGDTLLAGSQVLDGAVSMQVTACGVKTTLAGIQQLMHTAHHTDKTMDWNNKVATWFTSGLLVLAATTAIWHWPSGWQQSLQVTLSVLVVSCPCALALAIPSVLATASARLAKQGILLRDAGVLMRMMNITRIIVDKTGTLTSGEFSLKQTLVVGDVSEQALLQKAAAIAQYSSHPLTQVLHSIDSDIVVHEVLEQAGQGLSASIDNKQYRLGKLEFVAALSQSDTAALRAGIVATSDSELWLGNTDRVLGLLRLGDQLKPEAQPIITSMQQPVSIFSGDQPAAVTQLARQLAVDDARGGLLPEGKLDQLKKFQQAGDSVLVLGDGINDAPLLSAADVGMAIGTRHSLARVAADVLILHDDLAALPFLQRCAELTNHRIRQNLAWALLYNVSVIPAAMLGYLPPWLAALGMSLSSLLVVGNSLRFSALQGQVGSNNAEHDQQISELTNKPLPA